MTTWKILENSRDQAMDVDKKKQRSKTIVREHMEIHTSKSVVSPGLSDAMDSARDLYVQTFIKGLSRERLEMTVRCIYDVLFPVEDPSRPWNIGTVREIHNVLKDILGIELP